MPVSDAIANALKIQAVCVPVKPRYLFRYSPSSGSQAPQITYSRNIITESLVRMAGFIVRGLARCVVKDGRGRHCPELAPGQGSHLSNTNAAMRWHGGQISTGPAHP